jgi:hypothetical protein
LPLPLLSPAMLPAFPGPLGANDRIDRIGAGTRTGRNGVLRKASS